ncbi:MAG TPA: glycosyltransferase [Candidatus Saccharimonadales bacterium]|nr:glycosyltransferase [Candidatus Saccharimonadales bacterium]
MRILQVNKFHYARGGADKYYLSLGQALEKAGHEVAYFSMQHPRNEASAYAKYFVSRLSFNEGSLKDKLKTPGRIIYSLEAKHKFKKLLAAFKPDIIHIHNIYHQISPSILDVARHAGIPVVMHVHDYKLICPNYQLFAHGEICEACKPHKYCKCVQKKCFKNSRPKSFLAALEMFIHHSVLKIYEHGINTFITPSAFMKQKLVEFGWPAEKIKVITNPFDPQMTIVSGEENYQTEDYLLYFGRLSEEKGLKILIEAAALSGAKLKFVGTGPQKIELDILAKKINTNLEFLGFKSGQELKSLILKARAIVLPSIWLENMPLSLLEALNLGKVVIASKIGGIPEIIKDGDNGLLFIPGSIVDLARKINDLNNLDLVSIGERARASVKNFNETKNLQQVEVIYKEIMNKKNTPE